MNTAARRIEELVGSVFFVVPISECSVSWCGTVAKVKGVYLLVVYSLFNVFKSPHFTVS
jgi:hypothetical protein